MSLLVWNVFLAAVWAFAMGEFSLGNLAIGFALGYAVLWLGGSLFGSSAYCRRLPRLVELVVFFLWELVLANLRVAVEVITPRNRMRPGIIALPLDARSDLEIMLLAGLIALTPGSLSLGVSDDRRVLYVHAMYLHDIEKTKQSLKNGFERRLLEVLR